MEILARNVEPIASSVTRDQINAKYVQLTQNFNQMEHVYAQKASSLTLTLNLVSAAMNHVKHAKVSTSAVHAQQERH